MVAPGASAADATVATCGELAAALQEGGRVVLDAEIGTMSALCPPVAIEVGQPVLLHLADHAVYVGTLDPSGGAGLLVPSSSRLEIVGVTAATHDQSGMLAAFAGARAGIGAEPGSGAAGYIGIRDGVISGTSATGAAIGGSYAGRDDPDLRGTGGWPYAGSCVPSRRRQRRGHRRRLGRRLLRRHQQCRRPRRVVVRRGHR